MEGATLQRSGNPTLIKPNYPGPLRSVDGRQCRGVTIRTVTPPAFEGVAGGGQGGYEAANEVISEIGALMPAKKLSETDKVQAVLDLMQAKGTMAEICNRYGISPTYLYKLRDRALEAVKVALAGADKRDLSRQRQLELELSRAKQLLGDQALVIEILKKTR